MALDGFDTLARLLATAVLNGVWEGLALASLTWMLLRLTPRTSASTRYGIWSATLAIVLALPILCLTAASPSGSAPGQPPAPLQLSSRWPTILLAGWALIAAVMLGRLAWSYGYVRWLQRTATLLDAAWQQRAVRLTGSRRARVYASHETQVPVAIGFWRPSILIPYTLLDQLTAAELDHIVLHEWAHIRRRDNWTNCAHEFVQALFFFHPAVWFIGRALRLEREIACDDSVVGATGEPVPYASCLAKLVELNSCPPVSLSPGAAGDVRLLFRRVERLLHWRETPRFSALRFATASALLLASAPFASRMPALVDIPAPSLALAEPRPAIEAGRQELVSEERIRAANILMDTAAERLASADRILRAARQQVRIANQIAQGASGAPLSRVACQQPAGQPGQTNLNKI